MEGDTDRFVVPRALESHSRSVRVRGGGQVSEAVRLPLPPPRPWLAIRDVTRLDEGEAGFFGELLWSTHDEYLLDSWVPRIERGPRLQVPQRLLAARPDVLPFDCPGDEIEYRVLWHGLAQEHRLH